MENVPGITVGGSGMLQRALEVLGREYDIAGPETLSAWHYGVPQMRQRVFIIGYRKDLGTTPSLPQPTHHFDNNEQGALFLKQTPNAWDALSDIPAVDDFQELLSGDRVAYETEPLTDFQREMRGELRLNDDFSFTIEWDNAVCTNLRRTQHGESLLSRLETLDFGKADKVSGIRRIDPNELCTTIRAGTTKARGSWSAPRPLHPYQHRVLTTRECARIQTFPDWWEFHPAKWHGNRMVGNAVPPRLAKAVGSNISRELGVEPVHVAGDVLSRDFSLIADYVEKAHKSNYENRKVSQKVFSWSAKKMGATN
jgi:DNA (cytosine-5)-methyltransferase 1